MKKTIFTFLAVMFTVFMLKAQIPNFIGGYVTSLNGAAIPNHIVYIWTDSTSAFPIYTTATTNANGYYGANFAGLPGTGTIITFHVGTYDCNNIFHQQNITNANPQNMVNFSICVNSTSTCQANFIYNTSSAGSNIINFHDQSTGTPVNWAWSFGDGTSGTGANPIHTYTTSGNYIVCLTIATAGGCTSTICDTVTVNVSTTNSCNAAFQFYPDSLFGSNNYHFVNSSTSTYTGSYITYLWNFGDGTTSTAINPNHTFASNPAGGYHVCLIIKVYSSNTSGNLVCQDSTCAFVQIGTTTSCQNSFTNTHQGLNYAFTGSVSPAGQTTYSWNFGDGTTGSGQYVTHTFAQPAAGTAGYNVCLTTVTINSSGAACTANSCQFISINNTSGSIIQGHVYAGSTPVHNGYVVLYQANNATMGYTVFDTLALDSSGYFHFNYVSVPPVTPVFIIKAFLNASSPLFNQYFPTYYVHTLNWYNAAAVSPSANTVFFNINLIPVPSTTILGNGSIGGNVSNGGTKSTTVSGVPVILMDASNNPLKIQNTDANGNYLFTNLAAGDYKVVVEMLGANCTVVSIILNTDNQSSTGNNFVVNGTNITASLEESVWLSNHISDVYPNPSNGNASIDFSLLKNTTISIKTYNNLGQVVMSTEQEYTSGSHKLMLNTSALAEGIYTIQISSNNTTKIVKKFVKTR